MGRTSDARLRLTDAAYQLIRESSYGSVTIDSICARAGVKKGSFYYFFDSKPDLTIAAFHEWWRNWKVIVDTIFAQPTPPLNRVLDYIDRAVHNQLDSHARTGQVLGCPLFTLASEICKQDSPLCELVQDIMDTIQGHFVACVSEALAGQMEPEAARRRGHLLWTFYEGTLTQARVENNPELIRNLRAAAIELVGAQPAEAAVA